MNVYSISFYGWDGNSVIELVHNTKFTSADFTSMVNNILLEYFKELLTLASNSGEKITPSAVDSHNVIGIISDRMIKYHGFAKLKYAACYSDDSQIYDSNAWLGRRDRPTAMDDTTHAVYLELLGHINTEDDDNDEEE